MRNKQIKWGRLSLMFDVSIELFQLILFFFSFDVSRLKLNFWAVSCQLVNLRVSLSLTEILFMLLTRRCKVL